MFKDKIFHDLYSASYTIKVHNCNFWATSRQTRALLCKILFVAGKSVATAEPVHKVKSVAEVQRDSSHLGPKHRSNRVCCRGKVLLLNARIKNLTFALNLSGRQCSQLLPTWAQEASGVGWGDCFTERSTRGFNKYWMTPLLLNVFICFSTIFNLVIEYFLLSQGSGEAVEWCREKETWNWWGALATSSHYWLQTSANQPVQVGHDSLNLIITIGACSRYLDVYVHAMALSPLGDSIVKMNVTFHREYTEGRFNFS